MKKHPLCLSLSSAILLFFLISCFGKAKTDYQIKGKLINSSGETISLVDVSTQEMKVIDSAKVNEKGEFILTKKVPVKGFYSLQTSSSNFATLIADSTEHIIFEGDAKKLSEKYKVSGSTDSEALVTFNELTEKSIKEIQKIRYAQDSIRGVFQAYLNTTKDSVSVDSLSRSLEPVFNTLSVKYQSIIEGMSVFVRKYVEENLSSFATLAAVQMLNPEKEISYYSNVADALTKKYPTIETLKQFKAYVDSKKKISIGSPAPEITMKDKDGKMLTLSSLKGKVVLVDFWASWCKPCRAENPFVVEIYKKYKDKGLDVFSVSLDQNKEAWLAAIKKDNLIWNNHVSDLQMWQSPVVALYGFNGIPFTCLLDKNGNIVAKNLRGPELEEKIKSLL
jgi:thiol-disulfide isomerase/thioredoxin